MKNANNAKKVLNETLSTHLEDEGLTVKRGTIEEVVTSHMAGELTHEFCVKVYGCKPGRAQRIITTLNKLVPRKTNKGASKMTAKKTASAKPATKKPATKKGPEKKKVAKAPKIAKNGVTQPREGTVTRAVWDGLDKLKKTLKRVPTRKEALAALVKDIHKGTIGVQYRNWALFNGCYKKVTKAAPAAKKPVAKKPAGKKPVAKKVKR